MAAMTRTERLWRLKQESKARSPYTCPHCGSGAIYPSFAWDRGGTWICTVCRREFCEAS
jgi:ribosomal protein L37AE/L43A